MTAGHLYLFKWDALKKLLTKTLPLCKVGVIAEPQQN